MSKKKTKNKTEKIDDRFELRTKTAVVVVFLSLLKL